MKSRRVLFQTLAIVMATAGIGHLQAQDEAVPWLDNYEAALKEARRTGKPIFLEFRCEP